MPEVCKEELSEIYLGNDPNKALKVEPSRTGGWARGGAPSHTVDVRHAHPNGSTSWLVLADDAADNQQRFRFSTSLDPAEFPHKQHLTPLVCQALEVILIAGDWVPE